MSFFLCPTAGGTLSRTKKDRINSLCYVLCYVFFLLNFKTERYLFVSFLGLLNVLVHLLCNMLPYLFEKRPFVGKTITLN